MLANHKLIALTIWCFIASFSVLAQDDALIKMEYSSRHYTTRDGLPTDNIDCMFQDSRGFIWIGTEQGFVKYDGFTFKKYMSDRWLTINKIEENKKGEIIAYGYQYVFALDVATDSLRVVASTDRLSYSFENSPGLPPGYSIYNQRSDGTKSIYVLKDDSLSHFFSHPLLNEIHEIGSVYWDSLKQVFFIAGSQCVYEVSERGEEIARFESVDILRFIMQDDELWGVGATGIWRRERTGFTLVHAFEQELDGDIHVVNGPNRSLFIKDYKSVMRYQNGALETLIDGVNIITGLLLDNESNLWMTSLQGVYNFHKTDFITYIVNEKQADMVRSIVSADDGTIYMATMEGKIIRFGEGICEDLKCPPPDKSFIPAFAPGSISMGEAIYFSAFGDFLKYKNGKFEWMDIYAPYYSYSCKINDNEFIIGGMGFFVVCDGDGRVVRKVSHESVGRPSIYTVQADNEGRLWIGGHKGICIIGERDSIYIFNEQTRNCSVSAKDKSGRIWFGCENRIYRSAGDTIEFVTAIPDMVISNLCFSKSNRLILSTNNSVIIIDPDAMRMTSYSHVNGFTLGESAWNVIAEDNDGNIWLPTNNGVAKFNPDKLVRKQAPPVLYASSVESSSDNIHWTTLAGDNLNLKHTAKNIRFSYVGLCYSAPQNVRYQCRLKGFQEEWSQPAAEREAAFNNLPPGDYEFQLKANAGSSDSESNTIVIPFTIHPAFWQTWWFFALSILMLMLASISIALYFQRRKNARLLQRLEAEKQLNDLRIKSIRLKAIPHFNANVLAAIEFYIMNRSKEEANRLLSIYSNFTYQTLREVDKASRSLQEEIAYVKMYLQLEKLRFADKFDYEIHDIDADTKDVQLPNMILHTYCENAIKHGFATRASGCLLKILVNRKEGAVEVAVEDNGIGRDAAAKLNMHSSKQGLEILARQIEIYNRFNKQKIVQQVVDLYRDGVACGARFVIEIPDGFSYQ